MDPTAWEPSVLFQLEPSSALPTHMQHLQASPLLTCQYQRACLRSYSHTMNAYKIVQVVYSVPSCPRVHKKKHSEGDRDLPCTWQLQQAGRKNRKLSCT